MTTLQCWAGGCGCGDKITKPEERRWECVHTDRLIFTSRPQADGRWRHPGPRHNFTIHYFIQLWRKKKCKTNLCSLCIQYSGTNLFSLSNSKYDILNFYLGEEALIVILVLFVKCKIIYFISKHKWRIATQIFANFTNCILPNYTTSALTVKNWIKQYLPKIVFTNVTTTRISSVLFCGCVCDSSS